MSADVAQSLKNFEFLV